MGFLDGMRKFDPTSFRIGFNPVGVLATNDAMFLASRKAVFLTLASGERPSICNNMDMIQIMFSFLTSDGW